MVKKFHVFLLALALFCVLPACSPSPESQARQIESSINASKQELFDHIHPIGTATSVKLNSITTDGPYVDIRFTIFWEGPITKNGYTKLALRLDSEVERVTAFEVEDTNGITTENLGYAAGFILGSILQGD